VILSWRRALALILLGGSALACMLSASPSRAAPSAAGLLADRVYAEGRGFDQLTNPAYLARSLPDVLAYATGRDTTSVLTDPFRKAWAPARGDVTAISYRNRYGARIRGHLWRPRLPWRDPVTGRLVRAGLPALIMLNGLGTDETAYRGIEQSLAESGYVVMTFDPQGVAPSDTEPDPKARFCDPNGSWRRPQEIGLRERGPCAGVAPAPPTPGSLGPLADALGPIPVAGNYVAAAAFITALKLQRATFDASLQQAYENAAPNFALGALDAVSWLRSRANPWQGLIDVRRVGLMGHSLGAYGALLAGNGDPRRRFAAVVAFDDHGALPAGFGFHTPTMLQLSETADSDEPTIAPRAPDDHPSARIGLSIRATRTASMQVALAGSTHQEWSYIPYQLADPVAGPFLNASSLGERVGVYYALAWFDRFLKGRALRHSSAESAERRDADRRLLARTFDGSADRSSIGQGRYDAMHARNAPYKIAGRAVGTLLSSILRSAYAFDGRRCLDMQRGC
jgi:dienelactone hydrolase